MKETSLVPFKRRSLTVVPMSFHWRVAGDAAWDRIYRVTGDFIKSLSEMGPIILNLGNCFVDLTDTYKRKYGTKETASN